ncbi:hypothetical protein RZR97_08290 [Hydrogenimonas thermophila]|uniref:hypothetical protein n=1 Tax=Hydrogenimonas thermophila TaxID=223786 RepID=UPI002936E768|nr:hypothetical protein [Hydrogenimonas thermophila]WOE69106.1 hypothetical protein RZR91_08315 [Hydrogenimonas thermophila]WOE71616.1 hypothetical protein RZR97_08290 [Hydrogenimonas thermophila]
MSPCYDFSEIASLYKEIKKIVLLAENENDEKEVILSSVNEMRNALDHLMRCYDSPNEDDCLKQIDKAKGHLYRAGYDAYELLGIEATTIIKELLEKYDILAILIVFPDYFTEIYPIVSELEKQLADARAYKKVGYDFYNDDGEIDVERIQKAFEEYSKTIDRLLSIKDNIISKIPELQKKSEIIEIILFIKKIYKEYDIEVIQTAFPNYFSDIYPKIIEFEKALDEVRDKKDISNIQSFFDKYKHFVDNLYKARDEIVSKIDILKDVKSKKNKSKTKEIIVASIISAILGVLLGTLVTNYNNNIKIKVDSNISKKSVNISIK